MTNHKKENKELINQFIEEFNKENKLITIKKHKNVKALMSVKELKFTDVIGKCNLEVFVDGRKFLLEGMITVNRDAKPEPRIGYTTLERNRVLFHKDMKNTVEQLLDGKQINLRISNKCVSLTITHE